MTTHRWTSILMVGLLAACGGGEGGEQAAESSPTTAEPAAAATEAAPAESGPIDETLASRGEELFQAKACMGCHTIGGGRLTGPDLAGVTERRDRNWILHMIMRPDSMLQNDATAKELFAEYATPMVTMGVTAEEAAALYEYLRRANP